MIPKSILFLPSLHPSIDPWIQSVSQCFIFTLSQCKGPRPSINENECIILEQQFVSIFTLSAGFARWFTEDFHFCSLFVLVWYLLPLVVSHAASALSFIMSFQSLPSRSPPTTIVLQIDYQFCRFSLAPHPTALSAHRRFLCRIAKDLLVLMFACLWSKRRWSEWFFGQCSDAELAVIFLSGLVRVKALRSASPRQLTE